MILHATHTFSYSAKRKTSNERGVSYLVAELVDIMETWGYLLQDSNST
jgi:hypothetical protein